VRWDVTWDVTGTAATQSGSAWGAGDPPPTHLLLLISYLIRCIAAEFVRFLCLFQLLLCKSDKVIYQDVLRASAANVPFAAPDCKLVVTKARQGGKSLRLVSIASVAAASSEVCGPFPFALRFRVIAACDMGWHP